MALCLVDTVVQVALQVVERRSIQRLCAVELQSLACAVEHLPVADARVIAVLLRTDVGEELLGHRLVVVGHHLVALAVGIALAWALAVVIDADVLLGHHQLHAKAEHTGLLPQRLDSHLWTASTTVASLRSLLLLELHVCLQILADDELSVRRDDILQMEHGLQETHLVVGCHDTTFALLLHLERATFQAQAWILPHAEARLQVGAEVVVGGCTPEVGHQAIALLEHGLAIDVDVVNEARPAVPRNRQSASVHNQAGIVLHHLVRSAFCLSQNALDGGIGIVRQGKLLMGHQLVFLHQRLRLFQTEFDRKQVLLAVVGWRLEALQADDLPALCRHHQLVHPALGKGFAVGQHRPSHVVIAQVAEEVLVIDLHLSLGKVLGRGMDVLVAVLHLVGRGVVATVRSDEAVAVEVVVRSRIASVVASVGEDFLAADGALVAHGLVDKVPDEAALQRGVLAIEVPVLLHAAHAVAHGVGILTLDEGLIGVLSATFHLFVTSIHRAADIGVFGFVFIEATLVLHRTAGVVLLNPLVGGDEVGSHAGLVAHAPEDDGRVILEVEHVALVALHVSEGEGVVLG